jgi:hypothetical protein
LESAQKSAYIRVCFKKKTIYHLSSFLVRHIYESSISQQKILFRRDKYNEQIFTNKNFSKDFPRAEECAGTNFGTDIKIGRKIAFGTFYKLHQFYIESY